MSNPWSRYESEVVAMEQEMLAAGTVLGGRYEVLDSLQAGGFSAVYVGRQLDVDRPVAIKILHAPSNPRVADYYVESFLREVKLVGQVRHPNVVTVYDYGVHGGSRPYLVLELLSGHGLNLELARRGAMTIEAAVTRLSGALGAVHAAHECGIVHRDLKPSNLFLADPGELEERLIVLDFGLAFNIDEHLQRFTQTGEVRGTPQYVAPEYLEERIVTPAVDVYQLGLILVEMLTGVPVVNEKNVYGCFLAHSSGVLDVPQWVLDSAVGPVVTKATSHDYRARYQSAGELLAALEQAVD